MRLAAPIALVMANCLVVSSGCGSSATQDQTGDAPSMSEPTVATTSPIAAPAVALTESDLHPRVHLRTNRGDVTIELDMRAAPRTVTNFLSYVQSGHYDQTLFHQVEVGYVVVGGSYTPDLKERAVRYPIVSEADNGLKNTRGTIAMARSTDDPNSATCQFFINLSDNPSLDHRGSTPAEFGYCVFGRVIEGLDALDRISGLPVKSDERFLKMPVETVMIERADTVR